MDGSSVGSKERQGVVERECKSRSSGQSRLWLRDGGDRGWV